MATAREHFALDWIKADLLETLNDARVALDDYAEQGGEETRMRACLTGLHQVHGTLVMLQLKGVTQLADHLEQLAQALLAKKVADEAAAGQSLMQGILELPGYLDELQRGAEDSVSPSMALVNEIRALLSLEPLIDPAGGSLSEGASDEVIAQFNAIGGPEKVARIRSAYQNVLLSILKGEDRSVAVGTLEKIAVGLEKVTQGAPLARQWLAFGEFVSSLKQHTGVLESEAVKLLRRVDLEIKNLAKDSAAVLRRPVNMELVQQLLDGAVERDNRSETVTGLQEAVARDVSNNTLAISGRQALGSAAHALQEDLSLVKDKLDLMTRSEQVDLEELRQLTTPLKQIGSTLSLLGFESSREIVSDQVDAIENLVVLGDGDPQGVQSIAGALVQIDENLSGIILGSGQTEVEQITSDAQLQVLREARKDLDLIKQCIVDFVTAHWAVGHLEPVTGKLAEIRGALEIIPLSRAIAMLVRVGDYVESRLMQGHRPEWQELDQFADVISAVDYYLERLADETSSGADDILVVAERSLAELEAQDVDLQPMVATPGQAEAARDVVDESALEAVVQDAETAAEEMQPAAAEKAELPPIEVVEDDTALDTENLPELDEPKLALEEDAGFDLSNDVFAELEGAVGLEGADTAEPAPLAKQPEPAEPAAQMDDAAELPAAEPEVEDTPAPAAAQAAEEVEGPDPEIVEIFVEEIDEVLETIGEYLPHWRDNFADADALAEVRRAFHTLKGSGRIVQAVAIGELAWGVENMLNRVMDATVTPNEQFVAVIEAARQLVPPLRDAFAEGRAGDLDAISLIIEQADVLASGGELEPAALQAQAVEIEPESVPAPEAELAAPTDEADTAELELVELSDEAFDDAWLDDSFSVESDAADDADAFELIEPTELVEPTDAIESIEAIATTEAIEPSEIIEPPELIEPTEFVEPVEAEFEAKFEAEVLDDLSTAETDVDAEPLLEEEESTLDLFLGEALEHLEVLTRDNAASPWALSEGIARAFHTLAGGAALAQLEQVQLIVDPAYQVVEAFRDAPATAELQNFFTAAEGHLRDCLTALQAQESWEEPLEFVAAADDLLASRGSAPRAIDQLLDAPATAALFEAENGLMDYLAAAEHGEPYEPTDALQATLAELTGLAADMRAAPLAELATALGHTLARAAEVQRLPSGSQTVMRAAYNQLIDQLNEIAAGSELQQQTEMINALETLSFAEPAADQPATADAQTSAAGAEDTELTELAEVDDDLIEVFFEEAEEICEELEASVMSWKTERDNRIYMENLLRGLHTLKGGARLCGLVKLGDLAHDFESLVIEVQSDERSVDDALFTELNRRYDEIASRVTSVRGAFEGAGTSEPAPVETAAEVEADNVVELPTPDVKPLEPEVSDVNKVVEAVVTQVEPTLIEPAPAEPAAAKPAADKVAKAEAPAVPTERSSQEMVRVGSSLLEELVNLAGESSILRARIEQGMSDFTNSLDEMEITIERLREQLRRLEIETETQILHRHERNDGPQYENFDPLEMDRYNQLQQLSRGLSESASDMLDLKETLLFKARESETLLLQQARINTELQEGLMRTRMVPFSRLLPRLRRIVRQVSTELDKEVEFHAQNAEGELDRNLLERMVPPLEHMLRNAVDHGIESTELRRNYGKPAAGRIDLRLTREGGDVVIEISDDGAGIDVETVRAKAIERGLMADDANLSNEEILQFVLAAGFSTAKSVTQISGRGVGLDVVASEVKQLGGSVNIVSQPGKGTRFILRVPFTVSVNRALMVSVAEDLYAIPLNTIEGIVLLSPEQLQALYSSEGKTFEYAGVPYRVRYLGQYLGREYHGQASGQSSVPVVLVRSGDHAVAIHVDLVQGSREIVVKSLGPQFAGVGGISGATILGDGSVVVILDLLALIRAQQFERTKRGAPSRAKRTGPRCVMVVDDSVTVRKVTSRLLERQGMDVLVAKDGVEAVAMLQERRPDIMLLDIEMPRMDGFEVARQVRHDERLGDLPIVMISSRTGDKHKEHANQLGVNKFLGKPFQENELLATIDELVTRS